MILLDLPLPTSTNRLHKWTGRRKGKRVRLSDEYEAWRKEAGWLLVTQRPRKIMGPVELEYLVGKSRGDIGNFEKAATDLLVLHGVIEGDGPKIVRKITIGVDASVDGLRAIIKPLGSVASRVVERSSKREATGAHE